MKKIYLLLTTMMLVSVLNAQRIQDVNEFNSLTPVTQQEAENARRAGTQLKAEAGERGGTIFFYEDFANGFDGNNGLGGWTVEDTGGNNIWMVADDNSPAGEFSTNIGPLASTTADNGWVIFDCDFYNTPISEGFEDTEGWIISPEMDMSALNSVVVQWEQYFRYCCFPFAPVFLEVSNDGGNSWISFPGHGDFIESANVASANPLPTSVDISCAAAGQESVFIRFAYLQNPIVGNGYSHYYWGIDDVTIVENETEFDIQMTQLATGDIFNYFEYRDIPLEQAITEADGGLVAGVLYRNGGFADATNTTITVEILDDADNVLSTTVTDPFTVQSAANSELCPQNTNDTLYISTGWAPAATGDYSVRATITSDEMDSNEDNNVITRPVTYTDDEYSHDNEESWDVEFAPRENDNGDAFEPTGYGNFYLAPNSGTMAYGVLVAFGPSTAGFMEFEARLYEVQPDEALNDANFETSFHVIAPEYIPNTIADAELHYYPFEDPIEMSVANPNDTDGDVFYFAGVINDFETEDQFTVVGNGDSDTDNSTGVYELSGGGDFIWFTSQTASPAVRLITSQRVAVDELANQNGVELMQNVPNPANNTTLIQWYQVAGKEVTFEVMDAQGRVIEVRDLGTLPGGEHRINYDVNELSSGIYYYTLTFDGVRLTKKMVVSAK
ncbi:T9SS type A sorting domain-containing protein [Sanyastnella coralliicola]|uniref:T9SS type A sorting domain-containing protein n=1 Tax=Sanyastnella coralliicola TaxID=3069118 RepID=UPI0027B9DCD3|nr:T9SS type A sorting domain-containing protein [Longitalea sp. SCSIO 12813]